MNKPNKHSIKRLIWDAETSPNVVLSWRLGYKVKIDADNLLKERAIICICYKWEGENKVHSLTWDENQCDKAMLKEFIEVINEADESVAHNGDKFDLPWIRTRCLFHGIPTFPTYKTIDTLQWGKRNFLFNSNRLNYIAKFLGLGGKIKTEFGLWKDIVLDKDAGALKRMVEYCKRDVHLLEKVYQKLSLHCSHKTHVGVAAGLDKWTCPKDGSKHVHVCKTKITAHGTKQYQMKCSDCGSYYTISEKAHSQYQEYRKDLLERATAQKQPTKK